MNSPPPFELDVCPMFAAGRPPLVPILDALSRLEPGQALRLIAPIQPVPLFELLRQRGFNHDAKERPDGTWEILFRPEGASSL